MVEKENRKTKDSNMTEQKDWDMKHYLAIAALVFGVFSACIAVFFLFLRYNGFASGWSALVGILQPIIIGFILAYLLNPTMKFFEKNIKKLLKKRIKTEEKVNKISRAIATFAAVFVFLFLIFALIELIVPQLIKSISGMVTSMPQQAQNLADYLTTKFSSENKTANYISKLLVNSTEYIQKWVKSSLLPQATTYVASITSGIINVIGFLFNIVIGLIISIYVLLGKEKFIGQAKKAVFAIFKTNQANAIITTVKMSNHVFGRYITGQLTDAFIIGCLTYIGLSILNTPYAVLVAVIVGVTNIIPFFGPYIGAIPSFIIIALASPIQGVYFLIFVLLLQQVDGNIIAPKILGDSTGLSAFWIVFAILVGGGIFGFPGMVLGVPVFAILYNITTDIVNYLLRRKEMPTDTTQYIQVFSYDEKMKEFITEENEDSFSKNFKKNRNRKKSESAKTDDIEKQSDEDLDKKQ